MFHHHPILSSTDRPPPSLLRLWAHLGAQHATVEVTPLADERFGTTLELAVRFGKTLIVTEACPGGGGRRGWVSVWAVALACLLHFACRARRGNVGSSSAPGPLSEGWLRGAKSVSGFLFAASPAILVPSCPLGACNPCVLLAGFYPLASASEEEGEHGRSTIFAALSDDRLCKTMRDYYGGSWAYGKPSNTRGPVPFYDHPSGARRWTGWSRCSTRCCGGTS